MKLTLFHAISIFVVLFTFCLTGYASENNASKTPVNPANVDPAVIAMADKIVAEQAEASGPSVSDNFRVASNPPDSVRSTESRSSSVSKWLEDRAVRKDATGPQTEAHSVAKRSHAHYQDMEADMGGGWCDLCGCWMHHGLDPNGTPQSEIGHPYVCQGGANNQNCWQHYYRYCLSS